MATSTPAEATDGNLPLEQARRLRLVLRFEGFALDPARFELRQGGASVPLAPQPFDLVCKTEALLLGGSQRLRKGRD